MSWWDAAGITNLASQALKNAQKKIDKVLDISEEGRQKALAEKAKLPPSTSEDVAETEAAPAEPGAKDPFWDSWLGTDAVSALSGKQRGIRPSRVSPLGTRVQPASSRSPGATGERPGAAGERPGSTGERPGATAERPGAAADKPGATRPVAAPSLDVIVKSPVGQSRVSPLPKESSSPPLVVGEGTADIASGDDHTAMAPDKCEDTSESPDTGDVRKDLRPSSVDSVVTEEGSMLQVNAARIQNAPAKDSAPLRLGSKILKSEMETPAEVIEGMTGLEAPLSDRNEAEVTEFARTEEGDGAAPPYVKPSESFHEPHSDLSTVQSEPAASRYETTTENNDFPDVERLTYPAITVEEPREPLAVEGSSGARVLNFDDSALEESGLDGPSCGWGDDVSLSILTESQMSSGSGSGNPGFSDGVLEFSLESDSKVRSSSDAGIPSQTVDPDISVEESSVEAVGPRGLSLVGSESVVENSAEREQTRGDDKEEEEIVVDDVAELPEQSQLALTALDADDVSSDQGLDTDGGADEASDQMEQSAESGDTVIVDTGSSLQSSSFERPDCPDDDVTGDDSGRSGSGDIGDARDETDTMVDGTVVVSAGDTDTDDVSGDGGTSGDVGDDDSDAGPGDDDVTGVRCDVALALGEVDVAARESAAEEGSPEGGLNRTNTSTTLEGSLEGTDDLSESNRTLTGEEGEASLAATSESGDASAEAEAEKQTVGAAAEKISTSAGKLTSDPGSPPRGGSTGGSGGTTGGGGATLTSSSYVKTMLEEAMVESVKDTDSHTDSHSSSDMVRIESSPTSGHTSADEIETTTSSDIEIISHISTPTPNGGDARPFDLSPLRHALVRTVRRNSPPGHKRSDSGSGEEPLSPELAAADRKAANAEGTKETDASNPLETEKLLKERPAWLQPILEGSGRDLGGPASPLFTTDIPEDGLCPVPRHSAMEQEEFEDVESMSKRLAEVAEVLDARERKLVDMSRENMDLVEANNILRQQLQQSEESREAEMDDLNTLTEEFTKRIREAEKRMSVVLKEKEVQRKKLQDTEIELAKRLDNTATERMMREKDEQISELLEEGEKLSKQQLQSSNIIKKLRTKEKENESYIKTNSKKVDEQKAEIERLQNILDAKVDIEKKQVDAINQLNNAVKKQESEILRLKGELEEAQEKARSMQVALDNSYKEMAVLHKANATRASEAQGLALSSEIRAKEALQVALEQQQIQARQAQEALITQIEDLQLSLARLEREQGRREDVLRQEIADLQQRLQEAEERNQDLTQNVTQATRPLLRQIENLQSTYAAQSNTYERVEKNLTDRLSEAQTQLAVAQERERSATERAMDLETQLKVLESQTSILRQEKSRYQAQLETERTKVVLLEETRTSESAKIEAFKQNYLHEISELKKDKMVSENQLEMERLRSEAEKKKVALVHEQLREKELQLAQTRARAVSPSFSQSSKDISRENSFVMESPMTLSGVGLTQSLFVDVQQSPTRGMESMAEDVLEKSLLMATANGQRNTLYESLRVAGATNLVEGLQAQLKQREGEINQLQSDIQELERTREAMARELVSLSNKGQDMEEQLKEFPVVQKQFQDLDQRYNALLQMYGEKVEEVEELRLDLQDVKDMYKSQINELLKNQ